MGKHPKSVRPYISGCFPILIPPINHNRVPPAQDNTAHRPISDTYCLRRVAPETKKWLAVPCVGSASHLRAMVSP